MTDDRKTSNDDALIARVRQRVMDLVTRDGRHLTVPAGDDRWQPFLPGVQIKVLHEAAGVMCYLLRLSPGAVLPPHPHTADEECVVLEGEVALADGLRIGAGGFHLARGGSSHARITSEGGALLYLRGAAPLRP